MRHRKLGHPDSTSVESMLRETEASLATWLEDLLTHFCWRWVHSRPAKTDKGWRTALSGTPGFPDYQAVGPELRGGNRRHMVIELKSKGGRVSEEQANWLSMFLQVEGCEVYLLRPSNREEFEQIIVLGHSPNKIETLGFTSAWLNCWRRNE